MEQDSLILILTYITIAEKAKGYIFGIENLKEADYTDQYYTGRCENSNQDYLGQVISYDKKNKLIITRPVVEAGESLGFLPGDLEDKIDPYLRPLRDAMETILPTESVKRLFEAGIVEVAPLAYMRGRTLNNAVVILDEAQNTTCAQMKMFLTRMGENTKVFVTGDPSQIDLPKKVESGLMHSISILYKIEDIGFMELTAEDVVRNQLVKKIVKAYENEKE